MILINLFIAFFCILTISKKTISMSVSNQDLDELEALIRAYKDASTSIEKHSEVSPRNVKKPTARPVHEEEIEASKVGLRIMASSHAKTCGISSRAAYHVCAKKAINDPEQQQCALTFVETYMKCYFGETLQSGSKDLMHCSGSCMWNFDNCLVNSNKVEMFICMNGRDKCSSQCPWPNALQNTKRGYTNCDSICEGRYDLCYNNARVENMEDIHLCAVNRVICKTSSKCEL